MNSIAEPPVSKPLGPFSYLLDTEQSRVLYVSRAVLTMLVAVIPFALISHFGFPQAEGPVFELSLLHFLGIVFIAPYLETWLLAGTIALTRSLVPGLLGTALCCALIWAGLHSMQHPVWGLTVFSSFFIMTLVYLGWRKRSLSNAVNMCFAVHGSFNAVAFALMAISGPAG